MILGKAAASPAAFFGSLFGRSPIYDALLFLLQPLSVDLCFESSFLLTLYEHPKVHQLHVHIMLLRSIIAVTKTTG